jgi:lipopolysaccharide/colanic/teichoic acid biosynthesis glycosyltransferase
MMTREEVHEVVTEALKEHAAFCNLSTDDIDAIKTVSGFIKRFRNAAGNFVMLIIFVLLVMAIGGILYLVSAGNINLFKMFGIGI